MTRHRRLFCEHGPVCYWLSVRKECLRRDWQDLVRHTPFCRDNSVWHYPVIIKGHTSELMRRLDGVDERLQRNKVSNLRLACEKLDGYIIRPGQVFSLWKTVGKPTRRRGYLNGLTISNGRLGEAVGGGLCQLANLIHWLVLHSPLTVTELHHHTDAVFPDAGRRVPFGTGTSIFYKNVDYRFANNTDQDIQLRVWLQDGMLCGELRSEKPFPHRYRIEEEDHHFAKEGEDYYRNSFIYRRVIDRQSGEAVARELLLCNHSRVLYDHALIPAGEIRGEPGADSAG